MEAAYQKYKDKVNFVWVYGSEAHPEEYPFVKGSESKDLGWTHPYAISKTTTERAQRAKWMRTDLKPAAEIPMMVDFINSPGQQNNAIRREFLGSGFYSGYVIDCDGKVLMARSWAWFAKGRDWWGLPLASIESLHTFLDKYLASPPSCYAASTLPKPDGGSVSAPDTGVVAIPPPPTNPGAGGANDGCSVGGTANAGQLGLLFLLLFAFRAARRRR